MALRRIQEYIGHDAYIVSIEGNIFLYPPQKEPSNNIIIIYIGLCVSSYYLMIVSDCHLPFLGLQTAHEECAHV